MKKGIVVLLLVTIAIMLVLAAPAFAKTGTKSGGYWAYNTTNQRFAYNQTTGPIYASATVSPHSGYSTTSGKCKVCHAVHGAGIATNVNASEKLLRSSAADSCTYCHLGTGAFATDPYAYAPWDSLSNYYSNDSGPPSPIVVWTLPAGGHGVQDASAGRSGHNATHGHDNPQGVAASLKSYKGCVSCHAVHGANTMTDGALKPNILKNDPAKGTTAAVGSGWGTGGLGYGSKYNPTTTQAEFCEDATTVRRSSTGAEQPPPSSPRPSSRRNSRAAAITAPPVPPATTACSRPSRRASPSSAPSTTRATTAARTS